MKSENIIVDKTFKFSLDIISLFKKLQEEREFIISRQLLKSATSIGANVEEAIAAQSKRDFISKMSIASKEARETKYWLRLLEDSEITKIEVSNHLNEITYIINIITAQKTLITLNYKKLDHSKFIIQNSK
ncbi:four helix bundle protein [Salegentibacter salegens]|uniref:Four helix bundle protein n=1 Tax=Salegentibacter salegens TaxID=143223 RepID=A0A1M7JSB0_9FLAO|nr:four helix bundle protein [Salegentibacter salegens]PRX51919.1 four helix bundle protein [Salegentibacter salegens]SHM55922.1 four helix bundle protein [Salegentibacter salegens]